MREMASSIMEARLASVLDTESDGIIVLDEQAHILVFNKACERLFGFSAQEMIGRDIALLLAGEEDVRTHNSRIESAISIGDWRIIGADREVKARHRDGTIIPVELAIGVALTLEGRQFIAVLRDLRSRKESEHRLSELQAELARISRISAIAEMGSAIAHEINQPLTALMLYLQSMKRTDEPSNKTEAFTQHAMIDKAYTEAERACAIIRRMRKFAEKREAEHKLVDLRPLIGDAIELSMAGHRHHTRLTRVDDPDLPLMSVDPVQFQQVVVNLVRNALEAVSGREDAEIRVMTRRHSEVLELSVEDNGPGIPPEVIDELFDAFSTFKNSGLGLGLAISRTIAQNHGGDLKFNPGSGGRWTKFVLTLPLQGKLAEKKSTQP